MKLAYCPRGTYQAYLDSHRSRCMVNCISARTLTWLPVSTVTMLLSQ